MTFKTTIFVLLFLNCNITFSKTRQKLLLSGKVEKTIQLYKKNVLDSNTSLTYFKIIERKYQIKNIKFKKIIIEVK